MKTPQLAQARSEATHTASRRQTETTPRRTRGTKPVSATPPRIALEDRTLEEVLPPELIESLGHLESEGKDPASVLTDAVRRVLSSGEQSEAISTDCPEITFPTASVDLLCERFEAARNAGCYDDAITIFQGLLWCIQGNPALDNLSYALSLICEGDRLFQECSWALSSVKKRVFETPAYSPLEVHWQSLPPINIAELVKRRQAATANA